MATSVGQIGLDLVVNQNRFQSQMRGIESLAKKAGATLAAAFGVKKLIDFEKSCLELGSDLAEVQNVVDVTFPNMTAQVDKFAKSAAQSFGLSETMAKQFTGTFGAMAKAFGFSEEQAYDMGASLTKLAGDVASFYNLSQDEAYTKLKSVFTGETESLKDLGVVMTQTALDSYAMANGFGKTTAKMSEAEKVALRYSFVQNQLAAAQGDFARTSGSWANQIRILTLQFDSLKATIGQGLINLFTPVIRVINTVIGKLITLANAFKSFTELIIGQKSSNSASGQISAIGSAAAGASTGMDNAASSADNLSKSNKGVASSAKKAAEKMRALMGFDQINKLDSNTSRDSSTPSSGSSMGTSGIGGTGVDFGNLSRGETVIDKTDKKMSGLLKRCKELAAVFKKGFKIGFGDSEKRISSITENIKNIGKTLKEIFTDPDVVKAANDCANSLALSFGKMIGSFASIGITIASNLTGGIEGYLSKSSSYIRGKLVSLFNIAGDIASLAGDFWTAFSDIFSVFAGSEGQGITADIIGIFADGFLGAAEVGAQFIKDIEKIVVLPVVENSQKIKQTIENTLGSIQIVLDTLHQAVVDTFAKISEVYIAYVSPFITSIAEGISSIVETFLDGWNTYISPVLDNLAEKFSTVWQQHIQPALDGIIVLVGKVFENLQALWENLLQPLIEWIIENIMPIIGPILEKIGDLFLDLLAVAGDVITGITKVLSGFIDFCTGAFTGDFSKCFQGLNEILDGFKQIASSVFKFLQENVFKPLDDFVGNVFATDWSKHFGVLGGILDGFLKSGRDTIRDIQKVFSGLNDFVSGVFSGNWEKAWNGIKDIFVGVFNGLTDIARTPINAIIGGFNSVLGIVNGLINKVNNIRFKITVPDWIPGIGGNWWGFNGFNIPTIGTIPMLANGGFVKANTPQLAMIGDNRHQGEIVSPEDKLQEMALKAASMAGGNISREELESIINRAVMRIVAALSELVFYMDSNQVATAVRNAQAANDTRYNTVEVR
ncbi:hypothetical protein [Ruminococcus sp. J1101004sp1_RTP21198st1_B9_RTP21198_201120]|uniref:hypothetical protein n=1 Tax=Ruminococcus sp. J1101004sp1_RTP21198st1_B9_RTP21198_201120 TaxID=3141597 RepID=UPI0034A589E4